MSMGLKQNWCKLSEKDYVSYVLHTFSAKFFAGFVANSYPKISSVAQSLAGLDRVTFSQVRSLSVMQRLKWPELLLKKLSRWS